MRGARARTDDFGDVELEVSGRYARGCIERVIVDDSRSFIVALLFQIVEIGRTKRERERLILEQLVALEISSRIPDARRWTTRPQALPCPCRRPGDRPSFIPKPTATMSGFRSSTRDLAASLKRRKANDTEIQNVVAPPRILAPEPREQPTRVGLVLADRHAERPRIADASDTKGGRTRAC